MSDSDSRQNDYDVCLLASQMELAHQCRAIHFESIPINEQFNGQTVWTGTVEVFALIGCSEARKCYAWAKNVNQTRRQFVTVLQKGLVLSPETAVKAWLASKVVVIDPITEEAPEPARHVTGSPEIAD